MALSEYERRVLAQLETELATGRLRALRLLSRVLPFWPLLACVASAVPICVVVLLLAPTSIGVACVTGAVAAIALVWGFQRQRFIGAALRPDDCR